MEQSNYYQILQVDPAAEAEIIAVAYKRLAQKYHPDTNDSPTARHRMQEINRAYQVLRDPDARKLYDQDLIARTDLIDVQAEAARRQRDEMARRLATYEQQLYRQAVRRRRALFVLALLCVGLFTVAATAFAVARPQLRLTAAQPKMVGVWNGEWTDQAGYVYSCRIKLRINSKDQVSGTIVWILKSSPRMDEQLLVGRQATVYLKGTFDQVHRLVSVGSYRQDDPYDIVDINEYRMYLSSDNGVLSGETFNDGVWQGKLSAARLE